MHFGRTLKMEKCKNLVSVYMNFKNLLPQNYSTEFLDIAHKIFLCLIKVCSKGGAIYIIGEIIAKDNLNMANLLQTFENLLLQTYSTEFRDIFPNRPWECVIKICSSGGATCIIG